MKFDKETALKHKFWILLLVSLPLSLGAIFFLATAVSGDINLARKKADAEKKKYTTNIPDIKTPLDIQQARHEAEIEKAKEQVVWAQAYEEQEPLFTWPDLVEETYNFRSGLFAQKIKVYRGKAEPPPETAKKDRVMQGVVRESKGYYIEVETKDKQRHKLFESLRVDKNISVEGDDKVKDTQFGAIKKNDKVVIDFHRGKYFYEPLTNFELSTYKRNADKGYLSQIDPLLEQVDPMTETGEGVVQLRATGGGTWFYKKGAAESGDLPSKKFGQQKFINYLEQGWVFAQGDISEQAWLAQEDIWVQRELYRLIRLANDYISKFERVDPEVKADDKSKAQIFRNPYWELSLKWADGNKLSVKLTNLQHRRQKLDVKFRVVFNEDKPGGEEIPIGGLPLGPSGSEDASHTETYTFKDTLPRRGIYGVEQVLTWETAAVKRIDQISVGSLAPDEFSHSHRTFAYDQIPLKKLDPNAPPPAVIAVPAAPPRARGNKQQGPRDNGGNDLTPFELIRNRYAELTPQLSRRIPVSLALIVDQEHIFRVQRAFTNSKLRFLTTQLLMNRYTGSIRPVLPNLDTKLGPLPDPRRRNFAAAPPPPTDELETNVELAIYGIVTLYERYPPPLAAARGQGRSGEPSRTWYDKTIHPQSRRPVPPIEGNSMKLKKIDFSGLKGYLFQKGERIGLAICAVIGLLLLGMGLMKAGGSTVPYAETLKKASLSMEGKMNVPEGAGRTTTND